MNQLSLPALDEPEQARRAELLRDLAKYDYHQVREVAGVLCGLRMYLFTCAIEVDIVEAGSYQRRYCFERPVDAVVALATWDGTGHPNGPWIKCKGLGIDLLNPAFCEA